ncbi:thioredoxin family protein [Caproicibacterium amylolyticum]|jgi:hypothetical protein|uniref:Thioredoxin family protein n=1 Tax=Caproicibacterium amylolyticum TaxID=2766537 RepID=A0A7G9WG44_9FIRM|nr:thioredoxin family protein [Oscillospiraceae bacterium]QNO17656.1 thioredoxin family protein [Caproicibacterium amylolyticum]
MLAKLCCARSQIRRLSICSQTEIVTDFSQIAAYGVMTTPALVVDGKVVSYSEVC